MINYYFVYLKIYTRIYFTILINITDLRLRTKVSILVDLTIYYDVPKNI